MCSLFLFARILNESYLKFLQHYRIQIKVFRIKTFEAEPLTNFLRNILIFDRFDLTQILIEVETPLKHTKSSRIKVDLEND